MESTPTKSSGGTPSRKAQLEAMSREDLVQNNLKQTALLQKLKARYDEVQQSHAVKTKESDSKLHELQNQVEENEKISNDFKKKYSSTKEELDCTNMKLDTLMSSLQCLQEERDTLSKKIEDSKTNADNFKAKLALVENDKLELSDRLKDNEQQLSGLKEHIKTMTGKLQGAEKLGKENASFKNEIAALNITVSTLKQAKGQNDTASPDTNKMKAIIVELKKRLKAQCEANESLEKKLSNTEAANEAYQSEITEVKSKLDDLISVRSTLEDNLGFAMDEFYNSYVNLKADFEKSQNEVKSMFDQASCVARDLEKTTVENEKLVKDLASMDVFAKKNDELAIENDAFKAKIVELEKLLNDSTPSNHFKLLENQIKELQETNSKLLKNIEDAEEKYNVTYKECENTLTTQKQNMSVLENKKEKLETRLECVENELKDAMQQAADAQKKLEHDVQSVKDDNSRVVEENVNLKSSLMQLQREKDATDEKLKNTNQDKTVLSEKLEKMENRFLAKDGIIKESTERVQNLEKENARLEENLKMLEEGVEIQSVVQREIDALKEERDTLNLEKGQLDSQVKEHESKTKYFESEIERILELNSSLQSELDAKIEAFNNVQFQLEAAEKACHELKGAATSSEDTVMSLKKLLEETKMAVHKEKYDKESLEKEIESVKENLSNARNEIDRLNAVATEYSIVVAECDTLKTMHDNLVQNFQCLNQEKENMMNEKENMKLEFLKSQEKCDQFESVVIEKENEISTMRIKFENMTEVKNNDEEKMNGYVHEIKSLQVKKEMLENELALVKNNMETIESHKASDESARFDGILDEKKKLDVELSSLRESIEIKDKELVDLKMQLETARRELTDQVQMKDAEISSLIAKRNELENAGKDIEALRRQKEDDLKRIIIDKDSELEMQMAKLHDLLKTVQDYEKLQKSLQENITTLENLVKEKDVSAQNLQAKFCDDLKKIEIANQELKNNLDIKIEESIKLNSVITEKDAAIVEFETKIEICETQLQDARTEFENFRLKEKESGDSSTVEIAGLQREKLKLEASQSILDIENKKLTDDINAMLQEKEEFIKRNDELTDALNKAKYASDHYEKQMNDEAQMQNNLESQLSASEEKFRELAQRMEAENTQTSELKDKCVELEAQVESLTTELKTMKCKENEAIQKSAAGASEATKNLQQTLKDKEEYSNKLKVVAVKAKKELEITKKKLKSAEDEMAILNAKIQTMSTQLQGSQTQASNVQMMQLECDKLQDQLDQSEEEKKVLQKNLEDIVTQLKQAQAQKNDVDSELSQTKAKCDAMANEKKDISQLLVMTKATTEMLETERNRQGNEIENMKKNEEMLKEKIASLNEELGAQKSSLANTKQHLSEAKKGIKQHDMLALEIAQYERTVSELQDKIKTLTDDLQMEKDNSKGLEDRLAVINEDRNTAEQLRIEAEDRTNQINKQLTACREEIAGMESSMEEMKSKLADANLSVNEFQQETESVKLELSSNSTEVRRLQDKIISMETSHQRSNEIMQRKVNTLQADCELLKTEKDSLETEYEGYKIRVHTVLKQQKSKNQDQGRKSEDEENIAQLLSANVQLKQRLLDVQTKMRLQENEFQLVNGDYERLLQQHEQDKERSAERDARWKARVQELQLELATLQRQHSDIVAANKHKNESLIASHRIEVENLNESHAKEIETMKEKIYSMEKEILRLQVEEKSQSRSTSDNANRATSTPRKHQEVSSPIPASSARPPADLVHAHQRHSSYQHMLDYRSVAREDGEGEENPEVPQTFERLLSSASEIKAVSVITDSSITSEGRQKYLETKFEAQGRKLDHLAEVLRENEATVSRLTEQNRVLKEEIRRLEKNQERETSVANMEYLKNVLYKFITLPPCDEKKHLLPVMDTMLKFDPKEKATLQAMAADDGADQSQKGWSGYFQRWSGLQ